MSTCNTIESDVPGPLYVPNPPAIDLAYARNVVRDRSSDHDAIEHACATLAASPDPDDQMIAREVRLAVLWGANAVDMADVLADDERQDAVYHGAASVHTDAWARAHIMPVHPKPLRLRRFVPVLAFCALIAAACWYSMAFADALHFARGFK